MNFTETSCTREVKLLKKIVYGVERKWWLWGVKFRFNVQIPVKMSIPNFFESSEVFELLAVKIYPINYFSITVNNFRVTISKLSRKSLLKNSNRNIKNK